VAKVLEISERTFSRHSALGYLPPVVFAAALNNPEPA